MENLPESQQQKSGSGPPLFFIFQITGSSPYISEQISRQHLFLGSHQLSCWYRVIKLFLSTRDFLLQCLIEDAQTFREVIPSRLNIHWFSHSTSRPIYQCCSLKSHRGRHWVQYLMTKIRFPKIQGHTWQSSGIPLNWNFSPGFLKNSYIIMIHSSTVLCLYLYNWMKSLIICL